MSRLCRSALLVPGRNLRAARNCGLSLALWLTTAFTTCVGSELIGTNNDSRTVAAPPCQIRMCQLQDSQVCRLGKSESIAESKHLAKRRMAVIDHFQLDIGRNVNVVSIFQCQTQETLAVDF